MAELDEALNSRYKRLERESDLELYKSLRILRKEWESVFPWYVLSWRELEEDRLRKMGFDLKVGLGKSLASTFAIISLNNDPSTVYIAYLAEIGLDEGVPIERKVTSVPRKNKNDESRQAMRVVIEGAHLERIGAQLGDRLDLYVVDTTPDSQGYLRLVLRKVLR